VYYTVILCHKLVFLVLVRLIAILIARLIAIKMFSRIAALLVSLLVTSFVRAVTKNVVVGGTQKLKRTTVLKADAFYHDDRPIFSFHVLLDVR